MIVCTIFTAIGQLLYKSAAMNLTFNFVTLLTNWALYLGGISYFIGLIFMLKSYKYGELSLLYPFLSASYFWVVLFAPLLFPDEFFSWNKILGVIIIIVGMLFLGGGKK